MGKVAEMGTDGRNWMRNGCRNDVKLWKIVKKLGWGMEKFGTL